MYVGCDDIIRQHKAACLRVTSLLACKDLLWVGTSAGVILTMPLPHVSATTSKITTTLNVAGNKFYRGINVLNMKIIMERKQKFPQHEISWFI